MFQNLQDTFGNMLLHGNYLITFLPRETFFYNFAHTFCVVLGSHLCN